MACEKIETLLISKANDLGDEIYKRTLDQSMWLSMMKQETWPDESSDIISVLTYERSLPAAPVVFSDLRLNDQSRVHNPADAATAFTDANADGRFDGAVTNGGSCVVPAQKLTIAQTIRQYNLQQAAIESPDICLNDLRFAHKRREQLQNVVDIMSDVSAWVWKERYRDEYMRISKNKVVVAAGLPTGAAAMPESAPTSRLTQGVLDYFYMRLTRDGGGANPTSRVQGAPIFMLSIGAEAAQYLLKDNPEIREDLRNSDRVNELLAPMGISRAIGGFFHAIDPFPPRYDFVAGNAPGSKWVRRPAYIGVSTTKGLSYEINPAYEAAEFEDTILFHSDVARSVVPQPLNLPAGMRFDAQSYRGEFKWRNIPDRICNPDGNIGFFRAIFANGTKPVYPQYGYVFRHLRCPLNLGLVGC